MTLFSDGKNFLPERDGKVPLKRTPGVLALRLVHLMGSLLFSSHPGDLWRWLRSMLGRRRPLSYVLPWLTFDATRAITAELRPGARVFEFGSGHSTLYWAERGCRVQAVEDDQGWHGMLAPRIAAHEGCEVHFEPEKAGYLGRIEAVGGKFDVVLVDGSHRRDCIAPAIRALKPGGLLVVDNTDWHWFEDVHELVPATWQRLDFPGWAPFIGHPSKTSVWIAEKCA